MSSATSWLIRARQLRAENRIPECLESLAQAFNLDPHSARIRYERACVQLLIGNYADGFAAYESRWEAAGMRRPVDSDRATLGGEWRGADPAGKRVLLHAEQGYGDTIQFIRYVSKVAELGADVTVEVQPALRGLAGCMTLSGTLGTGIPNGAYDFHCSLMDLPGVFRTTVETVPPPVRMTFPEELKRLWRARIPDAGRMRVGFVWAGNPANSIDRRRSIPLARLRPMLDECAGAEIFSFQVGPAAEQLSASETGLTDLRPYLRSFVDTAAALLRMDRIVTIDSAVAHLAGSLGLEVWLLLPYSPCWRWLLNRSDSPWYPTLRLFRQPSPGDWESLLQDVRAAFTNSETPAGVL